MATSTRPDSVLKLSGFPPLVKNVPANWPTTPVPGKVSLLFSYNSTNIYHKFSPYTNYHDNIFSNVLSNRQPFVYTFIDEYQTSKFNQLTPEAKALLSTVNYTKDTLDDVLRVARFQISSWGGQFAAKQFLIQRTAPFDETRIWNPISPLLATVRPLSLGLGDAPLRHMEGGLLGGLIGIGGVLSSTIGISLLGNTYQTPQSTVGSGALPTPNSGQGKGLIRGETATRAYTRLDDLWSTQATGVSGFLGGIVKSAINAAIGVFGTTPKQPSGTQVRADEGTYTLMGLSTKFGNYTQVWYPPAKVTVSKPKIGTSLIDTISSLSTRITNIIANPLSLAGDALQGLLSTGAKGGGTFLRIKLISTPNGFLYKGASSGLSGYPINGGTTGYVLSDGAKYSNIINIVGTDDYTHSDMLVQYSYFIQDSLKYPSKFTDGNAEDAMERVTTINENLKRVIDGINNGGTYTAFVPQDSYVLSSGKLTSPGSMGYARINAINPKYPPGSKKGTYGVGNNYFQGTSGVRPVDGTLVSSPDRSLRLATTFRSDGINQLPVLSKDRKIPDSAKASYPRWEKWEPYDDDLIAFYFYDVVNNKYIPFRATVKGISEGNIGIWDELRFIGRADQLYSYNGFSRTLSFTFVVVINSIAELLPTYKKLNYLAGAVKPSNYTTSDKLGSNYSRFIVPPMYMITIGDLYKFQPMVIQTVNINIPDDAAWETLNQTNAEGGWSYLNGIVKSPSINKNYAQLPREFEVAITANLLEKERAIVGSAHFGHAPHKDDYVDGQFNTSPAEPVDYLPDPTDFSKNMVEYNAYGVSAPVTQATAQPTAVTPPPSTTPTNNPTNAGNISTWGRGTGTN